MIKKQNKNLLCKIQSRFVSPPISRLLRHAGGHVGPILLPRTHRGIIHQRTNTILTHICFNNLLTKPYNEILYRIVTLI